MDAAEEMHAEAEQRGCEFSATECDSSATRNGKLPLWAWLCAVLWGGVFLHAFFTGFPGSVYHVVAMGLLFTPTLYFLPMIRVGFPPLRRLLVTDFGLLLEYGDADRRIFWHDITGLTTWTNESGDIQVVGIRLNDGSAMLVQNLVDLNRLRYELERRTQLRAEAKGRFDALRVTASPGCAVCWATLTLVYLGVGGLRSVLDRPLGFEGFFPLAAGLVLVWAGMYLVWGHRLRRSWDRLAFPKLWRVLAAPRPVLRRMLAACLIGAGVFFIALAAFSG